MTLQEMADALGLKSTGNLRTAIRKGIIRAERVGSRTLVVTVEEVERYRREHLGKRGFASASHPHHGTRPAGKASSSPSVLDTGNTGAPTFPVRRDGHDDTQ